MNDSSAELLQAGQCTLWSKRAVRMSSKDILATVSGDNDATSSSNLSALERSWHTLHSASGSVNSLMCPEVSHTLGCKIIDESSPTQSGLARRSRSTKGLKCSFSTAPPTGRSRRSPERV